MLGSKVRDDQTFPLLIIPGSDFVTTIYCQLAVQAVLMAWSGIDGALGERMRRLDYELGLREWNMMLNIPANASNHFFFHRACCTVCIERNNGLMNLLPDGLRVTSLLVLVAKTPLDSPVSLFYLLRVT